MSSEAASRRSSTGGHRNLRWPQRWHGARRRECRIPCHCAAGLTAYRIRHTLQVRSSRRPGGPELPVLARPAPWPSSRDRIAACLVRPGACTLNGLGQLRGRGVPGGPGPTRRARAPCSILDTASVTEGCRPFVSDPFPQLDAAGVHGIYGHIKPHKTRTSFLEFCRYLRSLYSASIRIAIILLTHRISSVC